MFIMFYGTNTGFVFLALIMMMNFFCGLVDQQMCVQMYFSQDRCWRFSPWQTSDKLRAGYKPAWTLSSEMKLFNHDNRNDLLLLHYFIILFQSFFYKDKPN